MAIAKKRLKVAVREPGGSLELGIKPGRSARVVDDKVWVPEGSGDVRGRIRWKIARIDRDLESVSLQQSRGRETDDATAQYCDRAPADQTANPRITYPMWLTDEYATSRLTSGWTIATSAP